MLYQPTPAEIAQAVSWAQTCFPNETSRIARAACLLYPCSLTWDRLGRTWTRDSQRQPDDEDLVPRWYCLTTTTCQCYDYLNRNFSPLPGVTVQLCKHALALQMYGHLLEQQLARRTANGGDLQLECLEPGLWQLHDFTQVIGYALLKAYPDPLPCTFATPADTAAFARWLADHPALPPALIPSAGDEWHCAHPTPANGHLVATRAWSREQWEAYFATGHLPAPGDQR